MSQQAIMRRACQNLFQSLAAALTKHAGRQISSRDPETATQKVGRRQQEPGDNKSSVKKEKRE
jgi:hypothetical protein